MRERIQIERMGQGPEAVGHLASGKTVFVPGAAPGDVVDVQLVQEKANFARAQVVNVVEPSSVRTKALWQGEAAASLAPWQHLSYAYQLEAKRDNVVSNLHRIGGVPTETCDALVAPVAPSKRQWGYRNKLELATSLDASGRLCLGFHAEGTHDFFGSAACPLAVRTIEKAPKALQGALRFLQGSTNLGIFRVGLRSSLRTGETELALWTPPSAFPRAAAVKTLKSALKLTSIVRVMANQGKARKVKKVEVLDGKGFWSEELSGALFHASAPSFFQVNTAQAEKLISFVLQQLSGVPGTLNAQEDPLYGMRVADLYAGGGTFSIPLALAGADVVAVEAEGSSVRDLRRNAENNEVYVDVIGGDTARELPTLGALDALVVDPPRAGLAEGVVENIAAAQPHKIIYISCNPATWARDVKRFAENQYHLEVAQPVDLFPQTPHVEVASCFVRQ